MIVGGLTIVGTAGNPFMWVGCRAVLRASGCERGSCCEEENVLFHDVEYGLFRSNAGMMLSRTKTVRIEESFRCFSSILRSWEPFYMYRYGLCSVVHQDLPHWSVHYTRNSLIPVAMECNQPPGSTTHTVVSKVPHGYATLALLQPHLPGE